MEEPVTCSFCRLAMRIEKAETVLAGHAVCGAHLWALVRALEEGISIHKLVEKATQGHW